MTEEELLARIDELEKENDRLSRLVEDYEDEQQESEKKILALEEECENLKDTLVDIQDLTKQSL